MQIKKQDGSIFEIIAESANDSLLLTSFCWRENSKFGKNKFILIESDLLKIIKIIPEAKGKQCAFIRSISTCKGEIKKIFTKIVN